MSQRPNPRPLFLNEDGYFVFEDGTPVPEQPVGLKRALVGAFITMALIIVVPLLVGFATYRHIVNDQLDRNEALIRTVNSERIARTRAINEFIYQQCVAGELRDVVIVEQLRAALSRARATLPPGSPVLVHQEQAILDGINTLEPENEADCNPPSATKPKGTP